MIVTLSDYQIEGAQGPQGPAGPQGPSGADVAAAPDPVANFAALPLASENANAVILVDDPFILFRSDGVDWRPLNGLALLKAASDAHTVIEANQGITWAAADNGSGKVRLTSNAAHGLTTSPAVGASLYCTTTQNNWIAETYHEISAIISTTQIDLTTDIGSLGVPVFALAGTEVPIATIPVPPLSPNGGVEIKHSWLFTPASTNEKRVRIIFGGTRFHDSNQTGGSNTLKNTSTTIQNQGSRTSQLSSFAPGNGTGYGVTSGLPVYGSVDTSVSQNLTLSVMAGAANEVIPSSRYLIKLFG